MVRQFRGVASHRRGLFALIRRLKPMLNHGGPLRRSQCRGSFSAACPPPNDAFTNASLSLLARCSAPKPLPHKPTRPTRTGVAPSRQVVLGMPAALWPLCTQGE